MVGTLVLPAVGESERQVWGGGLILGWKAGGCRDVCELEKPLGRNLLREVGEHEAAWGGWYLPSLSSWSEGIRAE